MAQASHPRRRRRCRSRPPVSLTYDGGVASRSADRDLEALPGDVASLVERMPKAELHLHLDGSLRPTTALELARERGLDEGLDLAGMRARLIGPPQYLDQADLLRAFELPIALMQDEEALRRAAVELVEDVAGDWTRYVEIRWAPALHTARGLSLRDGISAVAGGARTAAQEAGVVVRLIAVALRSHEPATNVAVAEAATGFLDQGVTGFDLAGPEAAFPDPLVHRDAFDVARAAGLGITLHAGEWGGAAQVRRALEIAPSRIAHAAPAADDPVLMGELRARRVTLDVCPTSNVQAALVPRLADHPLPRLLRAGVPVTLSTDDRTVSDLTLVREYARAVTTLRITPSELWAMDRHALEVAFLHHDEALRGELAREFRQFGDGEPLLGGRQGRDGTLG